MTNAWPVSDRPGGPDRLMASLALRPLVKRETLGTRTRGVMDRIERWVPGRRTVAREIPELGLTYLLPTHSLLGRLIRRYGMYEEHIINWIVSRQDALAGGVFVDVGANIGWYTALFAKLAGKSGRVFAFEPDPTNFAVLADMLRRNVLAADLHQAAVGEAAGEGVLNLGHSGNPGSHTMLPGQYSEGKVAVPIVSLDTTVLPALDAARPIDLLKMALEGYELAAMKGAPLLLARTRNVVVEFSPALMRSAGIVPGELITLLVDQGFSIRRFRFDQPPTAIAPEALLGVDAPEQCDLLFSRDA